MVGDGKGGRPEAPGPAGPCPNRARNQPADLPLVWGCPAVRSVGVEMSAEVWAAPPAAKSGSAGGRGGEFEAGYIKEAGAEAYLCRHCLVCMFLDRLRPQQELAPVMTVNLS